MAVVPLSWEVGERKLMGLSSVQQPLHRNSRSLRENETFVYCSGKGGGD